MLNYKISPLDHSMFNTILEVRIYDINYGNHLGHDSLVSLFHEARVRFLKNFGYTELNINGFGILVTNLVVNYLDETFYADKIIIDIGIDNISKTSFELIYQATNHASNKIIARALTTITFYDYEKAKIAKIPQEFLKLMKPDQQLR